MRCLTRNPEKASFPEGVEVVRGDLSAPESLDAAFDGVTSAHLITFAGDDYAPIPHGAAIVEKLLAAGVSRVTLLKGEPMDCRPRSTDSARTHCDHRAGDRSRC